MAMLISALMLMAAGAAQASDSKTSRWFVRIGALRALYDSGATISNDRGIIPRASAGVTDSNTVIIDVGYDVTDHLALIFMGGFPPTAKVIGRGSVASFGELGKVRFGPAILSGIYRLTTWHGFGPYVGIGGAHLFILKSFDRSVTELKVHDSWGFALQGGAEYRLSRKLELFADYKHVWLNVNANGFLASAPVRARVTLDPDLVSAGIKFHFG